MELSKSHSVLKAALVEVGPPADYAGPAAWPTDKDVESLQKAVKIAPPKGVEFGSTRRSFTWRSATRTATESRHSIRR